MNASVQVNQRALRLSCVLMTALFSVSLAKAADFKDHGAFIRHAETAELKKLVPAKKIKVIEPHESVEREYEVIPADGLFNAIYGEKWKLAEEILFTCSDGYQPSIPVSRFLKYKAYLAFRRTDSEVFNLKNKTQNNEIVPLGPLYLIWDNLNDPYLKMMGAYDWPYQVTTFDLVKFADRFPKMAPPTSSSASVKRGFESYRQFCMTCHRINGEGGMKSIDLNLPKNVTEYRDDTWLRKWISDPTRIRAESKMPALNQALPNRDQVITDIISYLKAMKKKASGT